MTKLGCVGAGASVALAVTEMTGEGTARDAFAAIEITAAVVITLAVLGLLAVLVYRARRRDLTYRPESGITRVHACRAEVIGIVRPTPRALPVAPERTPERPRAAR